MQYLELNPKNPQSEFIFSKKKIAECAGRRSYNHADSIKQSVMNLNKCEMPGRGVTTFSAEGPVARMEEEIKIKLHATQTRKLQDSMSKAHNTSWLQCTEHLKSRIEASCKHKNCVKKRIQLIY